MYLDSNILLDRLLDNTGTSRRYAEAALLEGGVVTSAVLSEVTAKLEVEERRRRKSSGETFGAARQKVFRIARARDISELVEQAGASFDSSTTDAALMVMKMYGLDYTDCLLYALSMDGGEKVATSDKELAELLGDKHWEP